MKKGILLSTACYAMWGLFPIFWKLLGALNSFYTLAMRILWSMLFSCAFIALRGGFSKVRAALIDPRERLLLIGAGALITINWGSFIWGVGAGKLVETSLAYFISPLVTVLLGALVYREQLNALKWAAIAVAVVGVALPIVETGAFPALALTIAVSFGGYGVIKKDVKADSDTSMFVETAAMAPLALAFAAFMEFRGDGAVGALHGWEFLLLPLTGIVTSIPLMMFAAGIKRTPCSLAGILMYVNPILQLLVGMVLYGERLSPTQQIMFGCVWAAIALFLLGQRQSFRRAAVAAK